MGILRPGTGFRVFRFKPENEAVEIPSLVTSHFDFGTDVPTRRGLRKNTSGLGVLRPAQRPCVCGRRRALVAFAAQGLGQPSHTECCVAGMPTVVRFIGSLWGLLYRIGDPPPPALALRVF